MKVEVHLLVFSLCNGIGTPLVALIQAVLAFNALSGTHHITIDHTIVYEIMESSCKLCAEFLRAAHYPNSIQYMGDMSGFPDYAEHIFHSEYWRFFLTYATILVLTGTPCQSISRAAGMTKRRWFGIHAHPSNIWHLAHCGIVNLSKFAGLNKLLVFAENVIPFNQADLNHLDMTAGFRTKLEPMKHDGNTRPRLAWTSVKLPDCINLMKNEQNYFLLPPGWKYNMQFVFPTLRAIFPVLFWRWCQDPTDLTDQDRRTVQSCYLISPQGFRLPTLAIWIQLMGISTELATAMQTVFPCSKQVQFFHTFFGHITEDCSLHCYCENCSIILQALGEGWNLQLSTRVIRHLLQHRFHTDEDKLQFYNYMHSKPVHICHENCSQKRSKP